MKYEAFAIRKEGDGLTTSLGIIDDLEGFHINVGTFADDVIITFTEIKDV